MIIEKNIVSLQDIESSNDLEISNNRIEYSLDTNYEY